jgi:MFS family permease
MNVVFLVRFVTGLGVGSLSMVVPLYNAEISPPELRGSLVALQQLAICFGILVSPLPRMFTFDVYTSYGRSRTGSPMARTTSEAQGKRSLAPPGSCPSRSR